MTTTSATVDAQVQPTSRNFFTAVLAGLGLPITSTNLRALYAVEHLEGPSNYYNPLNVIQKEPGSWDINSVPVQGYPNFDEGVQGTVTLLSNPHWAGVRQALAASESVQSVLDAFQAAYTWDSGIHFSSGSAIYDFERGRSVGPNPGDGTTLSQRIGNMNGAGGAEGVTSTASSTSSSGGGTSFWSELLPWNWGSDIKSAESSVVNTVVTFATKMMFVVGGIVLVLLGAYAAIRPSMQRAGDQLEQAAPIAAAAA
jgi:hypothetical protein